jgi:hypothetical protein
MRSRNRKSVEKRIVRLTKEIAEIDSGFYGVHEPDNLLLVATALERKRDDIVRGAVLQLHTLIEDLLNQLILYCALQITEEKYKGRLRSKRAKAIRRMLHGAESLGFDMKLNFAVGLGLLTAPLQRQLMDLNTIRNKCSHNWILNKVIRRGRRPKQQKPPLLLFRGGDLHKVPVLRQFTDEYQGVYLRLYAKWVS